MRGSQRLIALSVLLALAGAVGGCSGGMANFDPADLLDWMDTKKKLPGERKPVFPDGVPGLEQGVPKDLYKGSRQEQIDQQNAAAAAAAAAPPRPLEPPPGSPAAKSKARSKQAVAPAAAPDPDAAPAEEENSVAAAPPPPKPPKIVRRRTTAPPPDPAPQQQQQSAFPAPLPSGSFSR